MDITHDALWISLLDLVKGNENINISNACVDIMTITYHHSQHGCIADHITS